MKIERKTYGKIKEEKINTVVDMLKKAVKEEYHHSLKINPKAWISEIEDNDCIFGELVRYEVRSSDSKSGTPTVLYFGPEFFETEMLEDIE